jgi:toxin ParE1/3/4
VDKLEQTCKALAKNPLMGTARDELLPNLRCFSVGNYVIYYRPVADGIDVVRVLHGARDESNLFGTP